MSAQILLQGQLAGTDDFLLAAPADRDNRAFEARLSWLALIGEVLPRALLAELQLPPLMLGASGGDRFMLILPDQARADAASAFLQRASDALLETTHGAVSLVWSATENLGDWTVVRKRLQEGMVRTRTLAPDFFEPFVLWPLPQDKTPRGMREAQSVSFSFDAPGLIAAGEGFDNLPVLRHAARNGDAMASPKELAKRAKGQKRYGILRGAIDDFSTRMRRLQSVEEHVHYSMLYKQFLAGEIELMCSHGDYFQRVTVLRAGTSDFAVVGSWDALASFGRELQRVFALFSEANLKDLPGAEARTITMSLTLAQASQPVAQVWEESARDLAAAQSMDKDCFYLLGRVLEWKQLNDAAELKDAIVQLNDEFRDGSRFVQQLRNLYRKVESPEVVDQERLRARALRFQRRFANVGTRREREFQKLRSHLMKELAGRNMRGRLRLRPEGLVALEWARLAED